MTHVLDDFCGLAMPVLCLVSPTLFVDLGPINAAMMFRCNGTFVPVTGWFGEVERIGIVGKSRPLYLNRRIQVRMSFGNQSGS